MKRIVYFVAFLTTFSSVCEAQMIKTKSLENKLKGIGKSTTNTGTSTGTSGSSAGTNSGTSGNSGSSSGTGTGTGTGTGVTGTVGGALSGVGSTVGNGTSSAGNTSVGSATGVNFTESEANAALKEALKIAAQAASSKASKANGFFKNDEIKILFPPDAKTVERVMRKAGFGSYVDEVVYAMNQAAEEASIQAWPAFSNAITQMTINDGVKIVTGPSNAGTQYMERTCRPELYNTFVPIVKRALEKVRMAVIWEKCISKYNKIPFTKKMTADLDVYVTQKTLDGLFHLMAQEEGKIRQDPASRTSDLLKKVFGRPI